MQIDLPKIVEPLLKPSIKDYRNIILYGSRGSAKSHSIAIILLLKCLQDPLRILCVREFQSSIKESCHKLFCDYIDKFSLNYYFDTTNNKISGQNGCEIIFSGIRNNPQSVKSLEGIDICWCEESQTISQFSLDLLIPTIRKVGSQLWFSMNPYLKSDPVYQMIINPKPKTLSIKMNFEDNPFCPQVLIEEAAHMKENDYEKWDNVWGGNPVKISDAIIFKGKFVVQEFESPLKADFLHGMDFGFSADPTGMVRCYVQDRCLWIDYEAGGYGIEVDEYGPHIRSIPTGAKWKWYADGATPGNISLLNRQGFNVEGVKKYAGSIEDGISHIRSYEKVIIHPRCKEVINEFKKYSWKVDKISGDIQPVPQDKNNHFIDALRYSLCKYIIKSGTSAATWSKLVK